MANFKGHICGGLVAYGAAIILISLGSYSLSWHLYWFIATLAGALFPDIDIRSKGQRLFLKILLLLLLLCLWLQAFIPLVIILVFSILPIIVPHRGLFHYLSFNIFCSIVVALFLVLLLPAKIEIILSTTLFFLLGVLSHLLLDKGMKAFNY